MNERVFRLASANDTAALARRLGMLVRPGVTLGLVGPLGAGKTTFVQSLAAGLGVPEHVPVVSPSFTIVNIYPGRERLAHIDLYRIEDPIELDGFGFEEFVDSPDFVTAIEWFDRLAEFGGEPPDTLLVCEFSFPQKGGEEERVLTMRTSHPGLEALLESLSA